MNSLHVPRTATHTQEVIVVLRGRVRTTVYDAAHNVVAVVDVAPGEAMALLRHRATATRSWRTTPASWRSRTGRTRERTKTGCGSRRENYELGITNYELGRAN